MVGWAALVVFTVLSIGGPLVGAGTFLRTEGFTSFAPWSATAEDTTPILLLTGDTIDSVAPQTILLSEQAGAGDFAEWNQYVAGGTELGGLPNSGAYSPLSLPWWVLPPELAAGYVKLLEIVVITVGMSLFLRRLGIVRVAWPVASLTFAASGFMVAWTNWPQTRVAALIPLLFWALDRASVRTRLIDAVPVALAVAAILLGGFPAIAGYGLYAGAAYVLVRSIVVRRRVLAVVGSGAVSAIGVVLGVALAGWQIVPFAVNASSVIDFDVRAQTPEMHLAWSALASALVPDLNGGPDPVGVWVPGHPVEVFSYLGAVVLVLVAVAILIPTRARSRHGATVFFTVAFFVAIVMTYVGDGFLAPFIELPVFSSNHIGRMRAMVGFFAAVLAAFGIHAALDPAPLRSVLRASRAHARVAWATVVRCILAGAIAVCAVTLVLTSLGQVPADRYLLMRREVMFVAVGAGIAIVLIASSWMFRLFPRSIVTAVIPVLIVVPALGVTSVWWQSSRDSTFYATTATHEFLAEHLGQDRYATVEQAMLPGSNTAYRLRSVGGHAFHTAEWRDLLRAVDPDSFATPTYSTLRAATLDESAGSPILDRLGVRFLVADPGTVVGTVESTPDSATTIAASDGVPVFSATGRGPLRGISVDLHSPAAGSGGVTIKADVVGGDGSVLATTSTWVRAFADVRSIAIAGDDIPTEAPWSVRLTLSGIDAPVELAASADGALAIGITRPEDDDLRIVHTGDATVYERASALERVRWASEEQVIEDPDAQVDALAAGSVPAEAVILDSADDAREPDAGSTAEIDAHQIEEDTFRYDVEAEGAGWLVIEDSFSRPGWTASIDGVSTTIASADHAAGAVFVSSGTHSVEVRYRTPGLVTGSWATMSAAIVLLVIAAAGVIRTVRARRGRLSD
ncbi:hypothetical protein GCM10023152_04020 [Agromyces bauzanensis]|uniref:YfhO family protein n=1 Tax=Agromyces bauzanensis TaxID=1308924 RepID=A0A917UNU2_9MICO|nr:hypothetical protein GCM10011372_06550 [Agromyces bauzanensis]